MLVIGILASIIMLQQVAVPGTGVLGVGFPVSLLVIGWSLLRGDLSVDPVRVALLMIAVAALCLTLIARWQPFSISSLALVVALYLPFALMMPVTSEGLADILGCYQLAMVLCAACAILQMGIQLLAGPDWAFPVSQLLPESLLVTGFNLKIPLDESLPYLKSTGLWFLEPSHLSQFLAIAVIIEIAYFGRWLVLALLGAAYLTSVSGTGIILLASAALPLALRSGRRWILLAAVLTVPVALLLQDVPPFSWFLARLDDFSNPLASGSMRFLAPYWFVRDVVAASPGSLLFGHGPGATTEAVMWTDYAVQDSVWLKLLAEYGLVGAVGFLTFYLWVLFRHSPNRVLSFAFLVQSMLLGGYLSAYYVQYLMLLLVGWPRLDEADRSRSIA